MSDFDEGLAVGLLLGRKKGGGTVYRDNVFHDIIENTTYLSGAELQLNDTYSIKMGAWFSPQKYGRMLGYSSCGLQNPSGTDTTTGTTLYNGIVFPSYNIDVAFAFVIFKNNTPIYAVVDTDNGIRFEREFSVDTIFDPDDVSKYRMYYYIPKDDYLIENIQGGGGIGVTASSGQQKSISIGGGGQMVVTYSYQRYSLIDESIFPPRVVKSGDRVTETKSATTNDGIRIFPCDEPVFTDLGTDELWAEVRNLYMACYEKLGLPTYPVEIIAPED